LWVKKSIFSPKSKIENPRVGLMNEEQLKKRTKDVAKRIIDLCRTLPNNREGRLIGDQLFRSGTSVAANYRAACRGRSKAEFISRLAIVEEEADETLLWLELIKEMGISNEPMVDALMKENDELIAIIVSSIKTVKQKKQIVNPNSKIGNPKS
jgi:four helix bundle protein